MQFPEFYVKGADVRITQAFDGCCSTVFNGSSWTHGHRAGLLSSAIIPRTYNGYDPSITDDVRYEKKRKTNEIIYLAVHGRVGGLLAQVHDLAGRSRARGRIFQEINYYRMSTS